MNPRSLLVKTAAYAVLVVAIASPPAIFVARTIFESGRRQDAPRFLLPLLSYIEAELEREWDGRPPRGPRLAQFEALSHHAVRVLAWGEPGIPAALRTTEHMLDLEDMHRRPLHHWARLDVGGRPVGAVELAFDPATALARGLPPPPAFPGPFSPDMAWIWILLLGLIVVPPLYVWVLRPLREMEAIAQRLGAGDLATPVAVHRRDEFGALERAFESMRVELAQALAQRERLLTDVSHEIRGPLARMMLALPLLRKDGAPRSVTEVFEQEVRTVDELVGDVLALARGGFQDRMAWSHQDLAQLAGQIVAERATSAAQRGVALTAELAPAPLAGDAKLLLRAIGNLVDNALKYTPPGGQVAVSTGPDAGGAWLRVADTGEGIPPEHLARIFEPFYRPDTSRSRETGGVGLGLSIVKRVAQSHGGTVTLASPGSGTVAELRLPAVQSG